MVFLLALGRVVVYNRFMKSWQTVREFYATLAKDMQHLGNTTGNPVAWDLQDDFMNLASAASWRASDTWRAE